VHAEDMGKWTGKGMVRGGGGGPGEGMERARRVEKSVG
jgi:hypothetical protein